MSNKCWHWLASQPEKNELIEVLVRLAEDYPHVFEQVLFNKGFTSEVISLIKSGRKIQAIKAYRESPTCPDRNLKACKEAVERYALERGIMEIKVPERDY